MKNIKSITKISTIALLASVGAFGFGSAAHAETVSITSPSTISICQTVAGQYDENSATYSLLYNAIPSSNIETTSSDGFAIHSSNNASGCTNFELSTYRFTSSDIQEGTIDIIPTSAELLTNTGAASYQLHFVVVNTVDDSGSITGKEAKLAYITKNGGTEKESSINFAYTKNYAPTYIRLSKTVKGTAGDVNATFAFTVRINGESGNSYVVKNTSTGISSSCAAATDCTINLKHGQAVTIGLNETNGQIPVGTTYTITENGATDYETHINSGTINTKTTGQQTAWENVSDNTFEYVNSKDGGVATGIILNILPYVALALLVAGSAICMKKFSKE